MANKKYSFILTVLITSLFLCGISEAFVVHEQGKVYISDRTGERWDVTQAKSIGFIPGRFQYGIGRNAFTTLVNSDLSEHTSSVAPHLRVIGVFEKSAAHAYSVPKLRWHEIANTKLGSKQIAVGY